MGDTTGIEWTDHTFNPWWGCTRVSPACEHCYAETWASRFGVGWGVKAERRTASEKVWRAPLRWNAAAAREGRRHRVFCASMADVFEDRRELDAPRAHLFALIVETPHLDWQLLTKRPEAAYSLVPPAWLDEFPTNVWMGTTVEDQRRADERIPHLLTLPASVRFLSCEPLLGPVSLDSAAGGTRWIGGQRGCNGTHRGIGSADCPREAHHHHDDRCRRGIDWVIVGGESGSSARPMHPDWARSLRDQCVRAGVR